MQADRRLKGYCLLACAVMLAAFAATMVPRPQDGFRGVMPDSADYVYGAEALLRGDYTVTYPYKAFLENGDAVTYDHRRVPQYPPGMSALLTPFVALGGYGGANWLPYLSALVLGALLVFLAFHLERPIAAPLALLFSLFSPAIFSLSIYVMSDVPAATLVLAVATLLVMGGRRSTVAVGIAAGFLPLLRIASLPLVLAGLLVGQGHRLVYALSALPLLAFLAGWQWLIYGSPFTSGYFANDYIQMPTSGLFSLQYALSPFAYDLADISGLNAAWHYPNAVAYLFQLAGRDNFLCPPFVGVLGFAALLVYAHRGDATGIFARFALAVVIFSYLTYVFYYYQSGRFFLPAATLLNAAASFGLVDVVARFATQRNLAALGSAEKATSH